MTGRPAVAAWTWTQARRFAARSQQEGMEAVAAIEPPPAGAASQHRPTVVAVLRVARASCLVRSAILQQWDAAHDDARPLIVGVTREDDGTFAAHAWLEGEPHAVDYIEIHRRPPD